MPYFCAVPRASSHSKSFDLQRQTTLEQADFIVLDCESTALDTVRARLTEVSAIKFRNGQEMGRYSTFVNPGMSIPAMATAVTGIDNAMVAQAPSEREALEKLCDFIGPSPLLVGDFPGYDMDLLPRRLQANGLGRYADRFVLEQAFCTRKLAGQVFPELQDVTAKAVGRWLGLPVLPAHRAENDVRNTAAVFFALIGQLQKTDPSMRTVGELKDFQGNAWKFSGR
jgi:DNA polymerase-3 subunit alpha (Gram-positive type)